VQDPIFKTFELAADAWDWLDAAGFQQRTNAFAGPHLEFEHRDGRWVVMFSPESETGPQDTEIKIFGV
jgi:predicted RNA binding protein YcfA (HicA-like mRNA interferase family)